MNHPPGNCAGGFAHARCIVGRKGNRDRFILRMAALRNTVEGNLVFVNLRKPLAVGSSQRYSGIIQRKHAPPKILDDS